MRKEFVSNFAASCFPRLLLLPYLEQLHQKGLLADFDEVPDLLGGQRGEFDPFDPLHGEHSPACEFGFHRVRRRALG